MQPLLLTSFLFIVPTLYALQNSIIDVSIASFACFITSFCNYYIQSENALLLDIIVVNSIATAYTLSAIWNLYKTLYLLYAVVIMIAICTVYVFRHYKNHHMCVHFLSIMGILVYVYCRIRSK